MLFLICTVFLNLSFLKGSFFIVFACSLLALSPEDVLPAVYLCTNKIAADHENMVGLISCFILIDVSLIISSFYLGLCLLLPPFYYDYNPIDTCFKKPV